MGLAVAFLLAAFAQEPPTSELVADFLKGSAPAREALLHLLEARRLKPDQPRAAELDILVFDLQEAAADERGKAVFRKLRDVRITIEMKNAPVSAILDYLREVSELDLWIDPAFDANKATQTLALRDTPLKDVLRVVCARSGADFDLDFTELRMVFEGKLPREPRTVKIKDRTLGETLELLTLPHGLDVRIEDGQVTIFERKK